MKLLGVTLIMSLAALVTTTVSAKPWPHAIIVYLNGQNENQLRGVHTATQRSIYVEIMDVAPITALEKSMTTGLSPDSERAIRQVEGRIERLSEAELQKVGESARARFEAAAYGIEEFPAIVIEDSFIVEGTFDIRHAVRLWRQYEARRNQ